MKRVLLAFAAAMLHLFLTGCASLPDATVRYYLTETKVTFKVVRTVACDGNNQLVMSNAVTPTPINTVDRGTAHDLPLAKLKGTASDTDVKLEFYDGGRLKSFNASSTGEGEAILKSVISVVTAAFAFDGGPKQFPKECALIKKFGGDKPLTLTYSGDVNPSVTGDQRIQPDPTSVGYVSEVGSAVGEVCAAVESKTLPAKPVSYGAKSGEVVLKAREPAAVKIKVTAGGDTCHSSTIWEGDVSIGQLGTAYDLPIPTPVLFGKETTGATFADSGALTSVQFTSNSGAGQALNVANAGLQAAQGETTTQKAAEIKAEADLIAQQQRLVQCLADPKNCK